MPDDLTDTTGGVIFNDTDSAGIQPKDVPLSDRPAPKLDSGLDGHTSLDKLFHEATDPKPTEPEEGDETTPEEPTPPEKKEAPAKPEPGKKDEEEKKKPEEQKKEAPKAEETKPAPEEPKDKLAEVKLPPHAKPGTVKSFDEVKRRAREEITTLKKELEDTKAKLPKPGQALAPEVQKEFDELRAFRKVHDFQNDPGFKKDFIDPIAANNKTILGKLKANGYTDEQIAKITEIGIDKLDWEPVIAALPTATRRSIEAMLVENERINDKKAAALEGAKNAPLEFAQKQRQVEIERKGQEEATVKQTLDSILPKLDWFKETPIPANATTEQKTEIEGRNAFHKDQIQRLNTMLGDPSPEMRGQMIAATLLAYQKQNEANYFKTQFEKANAELTRIRKASTTRSSRNASAPGDVPPPKQGLLVSGREALDALHKQLVNSE